MPNPENLISQFLAPPPNYDYPPASFNFTVKFDGESGDSSFSEISGLDAERNVIEIHEGGENQFSHRVPDRSKYSNLVLKRGVLLGNSVLALWCTTTFENRLNRPIIPKTVVVTLLDPAGAVLLAWNFINAWPVKWAVSTLSADKNEIAVETLELAYSYFTKS